METKIKNYDEYKSLTGRARELELEDRRENEAGMKVTTGSSEGES